MIKLLGKLRGFKFWSPFLGLVLLLSLVTTVVACATPVYADDETSETTNNSTIADPDDSTSTADTDTTDSSSETDTEEETTTTSTDDEDSSNTCYSQTGSMSWFICPLTTVISGAVDTIYGLIESILVINPISTDPDSPVYMVWNYLRQLSNIIFIIVVLVAILSQLTGFGMSNYNLKKMLPKLVLMAIAINLSFLVCLLAVDVSNILGLSINSFLDSIVDSLIANASATSADFGFGDAVTALFGGTAITVGGVAIAVGAAGGVAALFWLLLPVVISAFLAVLVGLLTIVFRQGVVMILIMIAPIAMVAYLLPNTERWFTRWRDLLAQMLFFYPMFAFLFGASSLIGWVLILSADSLFWVIVGLAVQVLPLFIAVNLMKMSGTILGQVSKTLDGLRGRANSGIGSWAGSHRQLAKAKYLSGQPKAINVPQRVRQNLNRHKSRRELDTKKYNETIDAENKAFANNYYNSSGKLTRRGANLIEAENAARYATARAMKNEDDHDNLTPEKFAPTWLGRRMPVWVGQGQKDRYDRIASNVTKSYDAVADQTSMSEYNKVKIATDRYERSYRANVEAMKGNFTERYQAIQRTAGVAGQAGINAILAQAASEQTKLEKGATDNFESYCKTLESNEELEKLLNLAFKDKNSMLLSAVVKNCADTKKYDILEKTLMARSGEIGGTSTEDLKMQNALANSLIGIKDHALLGNYATVIWKARGKSESINNSNEAKRLSGQIVPDTEDMENFFSFQEYVTSAERPTKFGLDAFSDISTSDKADAFSSQYSSALEFIRANNIGDNFTPAQIIHGVFQNPSHGSKQLKRIDNLMGTQAKWDKQREVLTFDSVEMRDEVRKRYQAVVESLSPANFAQFDADSLATYATLFTDNQYFTTDADGKVSVNNQNADDLHDHLKSGLEKLLDISGKREQVKKDYHNRDRQGRLDSMDGTVRNLFAEIFGPTPNNDNDQNENGEPNQAETSKKPKRQNRREQS